MFFGEDLDLDACEVLLHTRWSEKLRKAEPALFECKWFDHRELHPVRATYLFGHLFTTEVRRIIRKHVNDAPATVDRHGNVRDWHPIKSGDYLDPPKDSKRIAFWQRKITSLIKSRQIADKTGIPYDQYINAGLKHIYFGRMYLLNEVALPEPAALNGAECFNAILMSWMDVIDGQIQYAKSPRFQLTNDVIHPDIAEHQRFLCDQIARKTDPRPAIKKFIDLNLLSRQVATERFGASRVPAHTC